MENKGMITKSSNFDFQTTYTKLKQAIESNSNLKIILELDHQANAKRVGLDLAPTRIIMFGNPKLGTLLMQKNQTSGIDLPQKFLVIQEAGVVKVIHNAPALTKERHELKGVDEVLQKIAGVLNMLSDDATQN